MTVLEQIRDFANGVVRDVPVKLGVALAFDRAGVEWLDGFLDRTSRSSTFSDQDRERLADVMGSFLGECFVHVYGASWIEHEPGHWMIQMPGAHDLKVNVFGKTEKQLKGIEGESVLSFFDIAGELAEKGSDGLARPR